MTLLGTPTDRTTAPRANRARVPGWRNARLLVGLVLVAGSVLLGARVLAAADDTVGVWALAHDLPAGVPVGEDDLVVRRVRFPDTATADAYLSSAQAPDSAARLGRAVSAGELLPRAALASQDSAELVEVPVSLVSEDLPATVALGSTVDVWVAPGVSAVSERRPRAVRVLREVRVVAVPRAQQGLGPQTTRQVIVGVPLSRVGELETALGAMSGGRVIIARIS